MTYYIIRLTILALIDFSIDDIMTRFPTVRTIFLEPFNYRKYIFFRNRKQYLSYMEWKKKQGPEEWWR